MNGQQVTEYLDREGQGRIAYDVQGSGPLVLLVPGMGELRSTYRFIAPVLADAGYTAATTDLRGHGDSDASFLRYGDEETATDIEALIRALGKPAVIVGNSMAAGAAVLLAAEHPDLVRGLVLIGPFVRDPQIGAVKTLLFRAMTARPWAATVWRAYLPTLYASAKPADFEAYRDQVTASMRRPGYARAFSLTTRTSHARARESLARVTAPVLVLMGEQDPDFPEPRAEAEWIGSALDARIIMVPDAGHYPHAQQPTVSSAAIVEFLDGIEHDA